MRAISSAYVTAVLDVDLDPPTPYFAMELLQGTLLAELLQQGTAPGRGLEVDRVVQLAGQILQGLAAIHAVGVVHRDLKPGNIMVLHEGGKERIKLMDFGVAKRTDDADELVLTQHGDLLGTVPFMAPEQLRTEAVDGRTDLYALGTILFRMLTGTPLWPAVAAGAIIHLHLEAPVPSLFSRVRDAPFSAALDDVVRKSLAKRREDRFVSAVAMESALRSALQQPLATMDERVVRSVAHLKAQVVSEPANPTSVFESPTSAGHRPPAEPVTLPPPRRHPGEPRRPAPAHARPRRRRHGHRRRRRQPGWPDPGATARLARQRGPQQRGPARHPLSADTGPRRRTCRTTCRWRPSIGSAPRRRRRRRRRRCHRRHDHPRAHRSR